MNSDLNKGTMKRLTIIISLLVIIVIASQNIGLLVILIQNVYVAVLPIILGLCIAFVFNVPMRFFEELLSKLFKNVKNEKLCKLKRPCSLLTTLVVMFGILSIILLVVLPQISDTAIRLMEALPNSADRFMQTTRRVLASLHLSEEQIRNMEMSWESIFTAGYRLLESRMEELLGKASEVTNSVFGVILNGLLGCFIAVYVLLKKEQLCAFVKKSGKAYLSERIYASIRKVAILSNDIFTNYIKGQMLEAVILASLCFVGMTLLGFPYASVISVLMGFTALIPVVGAWLGGGIATLIILMVNQRAALWFLLFLVILQQLEGNIIYPKVVGKSVGVPGLLVLIAVILGGNIAGIVGILFSVPVMAILYTLFCENIERRIERKKEQKES